MKSFQARLMYSLDGVAPSTDYFGIISSTGAIYVKKLLNNDTASSYFVSCYKVLMIIKVMLKPYS